MNNKTSKEELHHWDKILDEYEQSISMPSYNNIGGVPETEINSYLSMSRDEL
jgi:hypothetical protein